jgi:pimeloyl-ACP methyl ester carboxylesterase
MDRVALAQLWRALGQHDVLARLSEIAVPTTWVAGTRDVVHPPASVAAVCDRIPDSRFVEIDAPHMAPLANPRALAQAIRGHLSWAAVHAE